MSADKSLKMGLKKKKVILAKKVKALPETHPAFRQAVRALISNTAQRKAIKGNQ